MPKTPLFTDGFAEVDNMASVHATSSPLPLPTLGPPAGEEQRPASGCSGSSVLTAEAPGECANASRRQ